jgi:hypothetical protein
MKTFSTTDMPTAIVLTLRGYALQTIDRSNKKRVAFLFTDCDALRSDIDQMNRGVLQVDPLAFWAAERKCKRLIYWEN